MPVFYSPRPFFLILILPGGGTSHSSASFDPSALSDGRFRHFEIQRMDDLRVRMQVRRPLRAHMKRWPVPYAPARLSRMTPSAPNISGEQRDAAPPQRSSKLMAMTCKKGQVDQRLPEAFRDLRGAGRSSA